MAYILQGNVMASVFTHPKTGYVLLEKSIDKKKVRLSTGRKATNKNLAWYKIHSDEEFFKLYYKKYENPNSILFSDYGQKIVEMTASNRNEFSQKTEIYKFNKLKKYFQGRAIDNIKPSDIQEWQNNMLMQVSPKTTKEYRSTLNQIFEFAYQDELINRNPIKAVRCPKLIYKEVEYFTKEEREILLSNCNDNLKNILQFAFFSGLRAGEIIALKWTHINFAKNKIDVCERVRRGTTAPPKGYKRRIIELLPQAKEALARQKLETGLSEFVFLTRFRKPYQNSDSITQSIQNLCESLNIRIGGLQTIRRSFNTMLKINGLPIDWILHQMGHNDHKVNKTHYTGIFEVDTAKINQIA